MSEEIFSAKTSLIFGGARSGKSYRAEQIVERHGQNNAQLRKVYMATAECHDEEMAARIKMHRERRDQSWVTIDVPLTLDIQIASEVKVNDIVLVDCLTMWLSNIMHAKLEIADELDKLIAAISVSPATLVFVSNELGHGIVPNNALAREFRDVHGLLNQRVASVVDHVEFVAAGLPLPLKP